MTGLICDDGRVDNSGVTMKGKHFWTAANLAGLSVVGVVFAVLAALTWRKWPDVIVDFGTQLYIPWRLTEGEVLYRDLLYLAGGPLSQYFNALLFKIFGVSFSTLIAANVAFSSVLLLFIYRRFMAVSDILTATMVCLGIVVVFTFSEYTPTGNYNYIAPYSHDIVHGLYLSLLAVGLLSDWLVHQRLHSALLAGLCTGLVFLTKPDIFVALSLCEAAALALHLLSRKEPRFPVKSLGLFGLAMMTPLLFFFLFFLRVEDWRMSLLSVAFGWVPLFQTAVRHNTYYVMWNGLDDPVTHLRQMGTHFLWAALGIGVYAITFRVLVRWKSSLVNVIIWLFLMLPLLYWAFLFRWVSCGSSLPLWCLTILVVLGWQLKKAPDIGMFAFPFLWTVFALALMSKLGVFTRIWHYGFALAMPAVVATIYFLTWLLPRLLENRYRVPAKYLRAAFLLTMLVGLVFLFDDSQLWYRQKNQPIGRNGDKILTFGPSMPVGEGIKSTLDWVDKNVPADGTLAVLPSGIMLNYLSRRINTTASLVWDPISMAVFDQTAMTARFEANPPDYILLVDQNQSEQGVGYFGTFPGYGVELMQWVKKNYKVMLIIGNEPFKDGRFGVEIFKRFTPPPDGNKIGMEYQCSRLQC
jgi:hypothetical protein